jgi:hypothetical protein
LSERERERDGNSPITAAAKARRRRPSTVFEKGAGNFIEWLSLFTIRVMKATHVVAEQTRHAELKARISDEMAITKSNGSNLTNLLFPRLEINAAWDHTPCGQTLAAGVLLVCYCPTLFIPGLPYYAWVNIRSYTSCTRYILYSSTV